jgi:hypothetical protein
VRKEDFLEGLRATQDRISEMIRDAKSEQAEGCLVAPEMILSMVREAKGEKAAECLEFAPGFVGVDLSRVEINGSEFTMISVRCGAHCSIVTFRADIQASELADRFSVLAEWLRNAV